MHRGPCSAKDEYQVRPRLKLSAHLDVCIVPGRRDTCVTAPCETFRRCSRALRTTLAPISHASLPRLRAAHQVPASVRLCVTTVVSVSDLVTSVLVRALALSYAGSWTRRRFTVAVDLGLVAEQESMRTDVRSYAF